MPVAYDSVASDLNNVNQLVIRGWGSQNFAVQRYGKSHGVQIFAPRTGENTRTNWGFTKRDGVLICATSPEPRAPEGFPLIVRIPPNKELSIIVK